MIILYCCCCVCTVGTIKGLGLVNLDPCCPTPMLTVKEFIYLQCGMLILLSVLLCCVCNGWW